MHQRVLVSAFVYHQGKCLLVRRGPQETFLPGYWENPGGKLEPGEDLITGLKREVKEETGLEVDVDDVYYAWQEITTYKGERTQFVELAYLVHPRTTAVQIEDSFSDWMWARLEDTKKLLLTDIMREEIRRGFLVATR